MKTIFHFTCECHLQRNDIDIAFQTKTKNKTISILFCPSQPSSSILIVTDFTSNASLNEKNAANNGSKLKNEEKNRNDANEKNVDNKMEGKIIKLNSEKNKIEKINLQTPSDSIKLSVKNHEENEYKKNERQNKSEDDLIIDKNLDENLINEKKEQSEIVDPLQLQNSKLERMFEEENSHNKSINSKHPNRNEEQSKKIATHSKAGNNQKSEEPQKNQHIPTNNTNRILFQVLLNQIKRIFRPCINEGRMTIEMADEGRNMIKGSDISWKKHLDEGKSSYLMISGSTKEILTVFCKNLHEKIMDARGIHNDPKNDNNKSILDNQISNKIVNSIDTKNINNNTKIEIESNNENFTRKKIDRNQTSQPPLSLPQRNKGRGIIPIYSKNSELIGKRPPPQQALITLSNLKRIDFSQKLPEFVLLLILSFLPKEYLQILKLVSKDLNFTVWKSVKTMDWRKKPELPNNLFIKFLKLAFTAETFISGKLKNVGTGTLIESLQTLKIKYLDLREYYKLNDKTLKSLLLNSSNLTYLKLPHSSYLTNDSVGTLNTYAKKLIGFELYANIKNIALLQNQINITESVLANILIRCIFITEFSIFKTSNIFFEKIADDRSLEERLEVLKIGYFVGKDGGVLRKIAEFKNLK